MVATHVPPSLRRLDAAQGSSFPNWPKRVTAIYAPLMPTFPDLKLGVFTSTLVREGHPVLLVFHDEDGDWQFLSSKEEREDECVLAHIGHLLDSDTSLETVADLPPGWKAWRLSVVDDWVREPTPADQPGI